MTTVGQRVLQRPKAQTTAAPMPPPPPPPEGFSRDEPWKITVFVTTEVGGWSESYFMLLVNDWQRDDRVDTLLVSVRRRLVDGQGVAAVRVPWEEKPRVYDPPLGPLPAAASTPGRA